MLPDWAIFKVLGENFLTKVAQIISNFLGYLEQPHSYVKTDVATSWVPFVTFGLLFTSTSGHTAKEFAYLPLCLFNV